MTPQQPYQRMWKRLHASCILPLLFALGFLVGYVWFVLLAITGGVDALPYQVHS